MAKLVILLLATMVVARRARSIDIGNGLLGLLGIGVGSQILSAVFDSPILVLLAHGVGLAALLALAWSIVAPRWSMIAALLGGAANLVPMLEAGAMPVSRQAVAFIGRSGDSPGGLTEQPHVIVDMSWDALRREPLLVLGDIVPVPVLDTVVSIGDPGSSPV